jgi:hypothetical protein
VAISIFLLAMWLGKAGNVYNNNNDPQLNLSLHVYGKTRVYYGGNKSSDTKVLKMREFYSEAVLREGGSPVLEKDVAKGRFTIFNVHARYSTYVLLYCRDNRDGNR